jgi:hypothetical protein
VKNVRLGLTLGSDYSAKSGLNSGYAEIADNPENAKRFKRATPAAAKRAQKQQKGIIMHTDSRKL